MSKCKNCLFYQYGWCGVITDSPDPNRDRECDGFRQMTNADYIRKMTDEDLAGYLSGKKAAIHAIDDACEITCEAMREKLEREGVMP